MAKSAVLRDLQALRDPAKAAFFPRFFKCGKGEYGEGDVFMGVTVPQMRTVAKKHRGLPLQEIEKLLENKIHEVRMVGLFILTSQYERAKDPKIKKSLVKFYLDHLKAVNNWDLVDSTAPQILGHSLLDQKDRKILYKFVAKNHLWTQRIGIVATQELIRHSQLADTVALSELLLDHTHDLIHKATGWMLREVGKKDVKTLEKFLEKHAHHMPRTMLRYAVERFPDSRRKMYMAKKRIKYCAK
jgi:3-methyladenine DNA glycosylase AlkD